MTRFVVKKNTLPYVHQWAVIDTETNKKVGEYKTKTIAEQACRGFEKYGLNRKSPTDERMIDNAVDAVQKRMRCPNGDPQPKPKRHSSKRIIELDK